MRRRETGEDGESGEGGEQQVQRPRAHAHHLGIIRVSLGPQPLLATQFCRQTATHHKRCICDLRGRASN